MNTPDPASPREFIEFWALRYSDPNERLYTANINCPHHTAETLTQLFRWKIGAWLFARTLEHTVKPHLLSRIEEARALPPDISAADFLQVFRDGGAIYRIFWLHCWHPRRFPIFDQHVHRAMTFICNGNMEELSEYGDEEKIHKFIEAYIPFFASVSDVGIPFDLKSDGVPGRKVDRALMAFGQAISIPASNVAVPPNKQLS
jgi:hypothetical protein